MSLALSQMSYCLYRWCMYVWGGSLVHTQVEATGQWQMSSSFALHSACKRVCPCHSVWMKARGQLVRLCSLLLPCGSHGSSSVCQAWLWAPFPIRLALQLTFKSGSLAKWSPLIFLDGGPASSSHLPVFSFSSTGDIDMHHCAQL